jgi:secreted trypsin-like serine protease
MKAPTRRVARCIAIGVMSTASAMVPTAVSADETPASPYIVNGNLASISQYPFYSQVFATDDGFGTFFCGGSVVAARIVLTAAHCVIGVDRISVIVGSDHLASGHTIRVTRWVTQGYNPDTSQNDVALLHLSAATTAPPIKIVGPNSDYRWQGDGNQLTAIGMGCTEPLSSVCNSPSGGPSPRLRHAPVDSRTDSGCDADLAIWGGIDARSMLCAGRISDPFGSHNAPNACYGDSGGPLVVAGPSGSMRLVGAVSWGGVNCGDYPVAYARLARFRSWLASEGVPIERDPFDPAPAVDVEWSATPLPGDFNGDGNTDVLWFGSGAVTDRIRLGNIYGKFQSGPLIDLPGVTAPVVGDWNGDGRDDLLVYEPGVTPDQILLSVPGGFTFGPAIDLNGTYTPVPGDFNGDGRDDVLLYAPGGAAADQMRLGTPLGRLGSGPAISIVGTFTRAIPGDFNGDRIDDIVWFASGSAGDLMRLGRPTATFTSGPAISLTTSAVPVVADFTGEGRDDIAWFDPNGADLLRESTATAGFTTGPEIVVDGNFVPFGGDFDGDGTGDVFWYRSGSASDKVWLGNPR